MGLELPVWGAPTVVWTVTALGLVGASVLDRFLDDDGSDDDDSGGMGGDDPFGGGMGGGGGGMGGGGGGMGGGDGLDDFDGMDEWDDGFDDGGGGADTDELEKRLDDLENEVASLSSTVSTVRSENEEISAAVDDIEEDVRNLLDIYEMVTRGINPFVDDSSGFDSVSGGGEGSFGLFDDEGEEAAGDDLDEDVANADANGFFDDEILDDDFEDDELGELDEEPDGDHTDDGDSAAAASEIGAADDEDDMNDDGKSFSELKEEYDSGEADWADENGNDDADATANDPFDDDLGGETDPFDGDLDDDGFDDGTGVDDDEVDAFEDGSADAGFEDVEPTSEPKAEPEPETAADRSRGPQPGGDPAEASGDGFEYVQKGDLSGSRGKPYLTELPGDYVGDLLVMEWLEFLVSESDVTDAVRAINYYERIEWVGPDAAARLRDFLSGFGTIDRNLVDRPGTDRLVREHHTRSLRYVTQLNGTSGHLLLLDRWDDLAGGSLVGGGPPAFGGGERGRGRGRRDDRRQRDDSGRRDERGRHEEERTSRNHDGGHESGRDAHGDHAGRDESGHAGRTETDRRANGHERNGGSPRPMNDPNPRSDRADPADGGWGDGR